VGERLSSSVKRCEACLDRVDQRVQHKYGLGTKSRCPYQGHRWEKERRRYEHRFPLFIAQLGVVVKLPSNLWVKKHKMWGKQLP
jgi:hypothetical protein